MEMEKNYSHMKFIELRGKFFLILARAIMSKAFVVKISIQVARDAKFRLRRLKLITNSLGVLNLIASSSQSGSGQNI